MKQVSWNIFLCSKLKRCLTQHLPTTHIPRLSDLWLRTATAGMLVHLDERVCMQRADRGV